MNFTREPIIETIVTPREGFKLIVRNSKGGGQEEYSVDAVEVVSFGASFFFRSLERPKPFLVPVSDYEILEVKETRVVLKNASIEKTIKISGGREATIKASKEGLGEKVAEPAEAITKKAAIEQRLEKKREKRRHRRRRGGQEEDKESSELSSTRETVESSEKEPGTPGAEVSDEMKVLPAIVSRFFPPPTTLISESLGRDKKKSEEALQKDASSAESISSSEEISQQNEEPPSFPSEDSSDEQSSMGDSKEMLRLNSESAEALLIPESPAVFYSVDSSL